MSGFCHLHLHTCYSLLDGACKLEDVMKKAVQLGQTAVAITDHGVMYGAVEFYKLAQKYGLRPIIGCEVKQHMLSCIGLYTLHSIGHLFDLIVK